MMKPTAPTTLPLASRSGSRVTTKDSSPNSMMSSMIGRPLSTTCRIWLFGITSSIGRPIVAAGSRTPRRAGYWPFIQTTRAWSSTITAPSQSSVKWASSDCDASWRKSSGVVMPRQLSIGQRRFAFGESAGQLEAEDRHAKQTADVRRRDKAAHARQTGGRINVLDHDVLAAELLQGIEDVDDAGVHDLVKVQRIDAGNRRHQVGDQQLAALAAARLGDLH